MKEPKEPDWSCPFLDSAIEELEKARKIAEELRSWGNWYKDALEAAREEHASELKDKDSLIDVLKDEISGLKSELKSYTT